ncbi:MAG: S41 family peptidase [Candidatus Saccharibacteria bacterium]|nr:S41 family peptidase [Candidatus Saccharibacteria bacterium]MCA9339560.1 S41 family peptidase [Candidatus Saccharibacteria bacterium]
MTDSQPPMQESHDHRPRRRTGVSKNFYFVSMAIVALAGFVVGTRQTELAAIMAPLIGVKTSSEALDLAVVQKAYRELKANYDGTVDSSVLADGAARGMVAAVGDRYTIFMDKTEAEQFSKELSGEVTGIGCELGVRNDAATVVRVLENSPAAQAGLLAGDQFISVNDSSVEGLDSSEVASKIRGPEGTTVKVAVKRGEETKNFSITRAKLSDPSVRSSVENGIGTLTITRFDANTAALTRQAAQGFVTQGVKGVILDLRDDGGGYLDAAQDVASLWLRDKVIVTEKTNNTVTGTIRTKGEPVLENIKTVVLVNGGSASASEIVAGALQDHKAATLIGEKTYGKGTVQKLIDLPDGRQLKVTIARWFTPNGKNITKEGIAPDTAVQLTSDDRNTGRDPQLEAARKIF